MLGNGYSYGKMTDTQTRLNADIFNPLIKNSQQYMMNKKYVSIHSEDRNVFKYPNSNTFELDLPEDYRNVASVRLTEWNFPHRYVPFSVRNNNVFLRVRMTATDTLAEYDIQIQDGDYLPHQMVIELQQRLNAITKSQFYVAYNEVSGKIWFGNRVEPFELLNEDIFSNKCESNSVNCAVGRNHLPEFVNWGLPANLGLTISNITSTSSDIYPRFYYLEGGYWMGQPIDGATYYYVECPRTINFEINNVVYMELDNNNCIDETSPFNVSAFTQQTNETNSIVNGSFAKLLMKNDANKFIDYERIPYKWYYPPADRIRRLRFRFRHHNGQLVDFGQVEFNFMLEFTLANPTNDRQIIKVGY